MTGGTGNPLFDFWLNNQSRMFEAQSDWFQRQSGAPSQSAQESETWSNFQDIWAGSESRFHDWIQSSQEWFSAQQSSTENAGAAEALTCMLDPRQFMKFASDTLGLMFSKLADGPDFADMGVLEKRFLKVGRDWESFREACQHYQEVLSAAWARAWQQYTEAFVGTDSDNTAGAGEWLERWLEIADRELVATLRSAEYLEAQQRLFRAGTTYKVRQDHVIEQWCDALGMPSRSEVDDLHRMVYELRREVRSLQQELAELRKPSAPRNGALEQQDKPAVRQKKPTAQRKKTSVQQQNKGRPAGSAAGPREKRG